MMSGIRGANTKPELRVRRHLFAAGLRYRLHKKGLPGRPDLVLARCQTAVFVHGCFWHQHPGCRFAARPGTNAEFWQTKFVANRERDARKEAELKALGWRVEVVWECEGVDRLDRLVQTLIATAAARR